MAADTCLQAQDTKASLALTSPVSCQVFQRGKTDTAAILIEGTVSDKADVIEAMASLSPGAKRGTPVKWTGITPKGQTVSGKFTGRLTLPAGGWYQVTVRARSGSRIIAEQAVEKVGFGAGWDKSTLSATKGETLKGPDFLVGIEKRADAQKFSQVEHLRWFANALTTAEKASAVIGIAQKINDSITTKKTDLTASLKPEEAEADHGVKAATKDGLSHNETSSMANKSADTVKAVSGVIHVEAASFAKTGGKISWGGQFPNVLVHDSFGGGKQVYFQQQMKEQWADYTIDVPAAGACQIVMQAACINEDQLLEVRSGDKLLATLPLAPTFGVWQETKPVTLTLAKGQQTLRIQTPVSVNAENHKRGIAVKWFELRAPQ